MSFFLDLELTRVIELNCGFDKAFDFFSNVESMGKLFPRVEKLEDLGKGSYKWTIEEMGVSKYTLGVIYGAKYSFDKKKGLVTWEPVPGIGNGVSHGKVEIKGKGDKTVVNFHTTLKLEVPFTSLAKPIIKPFAASQFNANLDQFQKNVEKALSA
ncbi:MAG: SRPBCC family protein [Thermodesulfobacteriota bacterium]